MTSELNTILRECGYQINWNSVINEKNSIDLKICHTCKSFFCAPVKSKIKMYCSAKCYQIRKR